MNDILREFLLETNENLAQLDLDLVTLERDPGERETLSRVFRTLHTVKGTSGFLGLARLQALGHAGENLLSRLRARELTFDSEIATALLAVVDAIRTILTAIEATEQEGDGDYTAVIHTLERLTQGASGSGGLPRVAKPIVAELPTSRPPEPLAPTLITQSPIPKRIETRPPAPATVAGPSTPRPPEPLAPTLIAQSPISKQTESPTPKSTETRATAIVAESPIMEPTETRAPAVADTSVRVDIGLLDKLMNLVGELVLARNQVMQFSTTQQDAAFLGTVQRLNLLTTELQAGVMKTRMQPIGNVWSKFPRIVRDLALACGKQVRIELEGQETELDRTIVEAIRDPLTHMVRNAVDHGIEPPTERLGRDKPAEGRLHLHASHEGGKVVIEIADDGGGIDPVRVRNKAIQAALITAEQAARMSEQELVNLVFMPGFSTADRVTHFSGRGVGMDVVRTNIEKIGGTVDIASQVGRGTNVRMKIPLTLAIIPALTITTGGDRYAIPQVSLLELVRLEGKQTQKGIEFIQGVPVYRLRGNLLPLVHLDRELQVEPANRPIGEVSIVVIQADDRPFGLVVDDIHDTEEIVVKPLQKQLKGITLFSGATIMGDGRVALILDVLGLAQRAGVVSGVRDRALAEKTVAAEPKGDRQTLLLFATPAGGRMAVPLAQVARLEEFPRTMVEKAGGQDVVQYRGEILPLIHISRALWQARGVNGHNGKRRIRPTDRPPREENEKLQVVVHAERGRRVGLVVGQILDIVEETINTRTQASRPGILFTAVVQDRVTEFLDVDGIIRSADSSTTRAEATTTTVED
ncbi:MAG TPA: chemotaxis protein CheW [Gemmata sp.]|nr:chemotaxis protein CheW [Gemmata sp.]